MNIPDLLILRHGETQWNAQGRMQGHLDSPLTDVGITQAQAQAGILARQDLTGFTAFSSPQPRALHTAGIALGGLVQGINTDPRLREIEVGDWAGALRKPLASQYGAGLSYYNHAPGGEGFAGLRARCTEFLHGLSHPCIIVTHGITSRMLRAVVLGLKDDQIDTLPGGQGVIYRVRAGQHEQLV